jgi:hypothetical protein
VGKTWQVFDGAEFGAKADITGARMDLRNIMQNLYRTTLPSPKAYQDRVSAGFLNKAAADSQTPHVGGLLLHQQNSRLPIRLTAVKGRRSTRRRHG